MILWIAIFLLSLVVMVQGADWLLESAERIGLTLGFSSFLIGVVLVGLGTSLPELVTALFAVSDGATEIVVGNAIGSNIANILLVIGVSSIVAGNLSVTKSLIDIDIPLLSITTVLLAGIVFDGQVEMFEALLLLVGYIIYFLYTIYFGKSDEDTMPPGVDIGLDKSDSQGIDKTDESVANIPESVSVRDILYLLIGAAGLFTGSKYLVESVVELAALWGISAGVISLVAVSIGTSLPELLVSIRAAWQNKSEVALGNIFGSNVFNLLLVVGVPGLFTTLRVDAETLSIGLPVLLASTFLFIISGISRRVHAWEGGMYLLLYAFFMIQLFG